MKSKSQGQSPPGNASVSPTHVWWEQGSTSDWRCIEHEALSWQLKHITALTPSSHSSVPMPDPPWQCEHWGQAWQKSSAYIWSLAAPLCLSHLRPSFRAWVKGTGRHDIPGLQALTLEVSTQHRQKEPLRKWNVLPGRIVVSLGPADNHLFLGKLRHGICH